MVYDQQLGFHITMLEYGDLDSSYGGRNIDFSTTRWCLTNDGCKLPRRASFTYHVNCKLKYCRQLYLRRKHPVYNDASNLPVPSVPFVFPNGQGDSEKFMNGRQNSVKWGSKYGPLYRIWSGTNSEMFVP